MEAIIEDSPRIPEQSGKKSYAGDIFKMVTGNSIAQIITVLSSPFLTRIFSPDAFGLMTLFVSIIGIVKVISCLRYEMAIVLPESDDEAVNILGGSILIVIGVTSISMVLLVIFGTPLLILFNAIELNMFLWIMPFSIFSGGIFLALSYWFTRTRKFSQLSFVQVVNSFTTYGSQLLLGIIGFATSGSLIYAYVFGSYLVIIIMGVQIWNIDGQMILKNIRIEKVIQQLGRYRKFPLYDSIAALLNNISWQLPAFILAAFFSKTEVGYYALSFRLLNMPMSLIGNSIGQVFFQRAAVAKNSGMLAQVVENNFRYLVVLGLLPFVILTFIGKDLFLLVFGAEWGEAGIYAQILSVWIFFWFISSPLSTLFRVLERQKFSLILNIVIFLTRIISLSIGGYLGSARLALTLFSVTGVFLYGYLGISIGIASGVTKAKIWSILGKNILVCLPVGAFLWFLEYLVLPFWMILIVSILIGIIYYLYHGLVTFSGLDHLRRFLKRD